MKKSNNSSYNRIMNYLINSKSNIDVEEKRFLLKYATQLLKYNIENQRKEHKKDIKKSLTDIYNSLEKQQYTPIQYARLIKVLNIYELLNYNDLKKASYELDKLFLELDLKIRDNSSLSYNLLNERKMAK